MSLTRTMKRGFLNTDKAKRKLAAEPDVPSIDRGKGKEKADRMPRMAHTRDAYPSPGAPDPPLLDLHSLPPSFKSQLDNPEGKKRFIFRQWPRDPDGKVIVPSTIRGKEAGNGLDLWGATLYDFFYVRRIPDNIHGLTISTGSKIAKVMRSFGELDFAPDELAWTDLEADPREILPWDPAQAVAVHERRVHASSGIVGSTNRMRSTDPVGEGEAEVHIKSASHPSGSEPTQSIDMNDTVEVVKDLTSQDHAKPSSGTLTDAMDDAETQQPPSGIPLESPFHPSHYPAPWPLIPFESPCPPFPLQRGIPIHLLPKKLFVHDPWNLLNANLTTHSDEHLKETWHSKTDCIHTYTLSLPSESKKLAEAASSAAATAQDEPQEASIFPQQIQGPTKQPAIQIFFDQQPRKLAQVPEAHLYLSPKGRLGTGHHSVVYEADLELPRDLFCESDYCKICTEEQIVSEIDRIRESGEWERHLNEQAAKYEGRYFASHDAASPSSAQVPPRYVGCVKVRDEDVPMQTMSMMAATESSEIPPPDAPNQHLVRVSNLERHRYIDYEGAIIPLHPPIQWQNPSRLETICVHQAKKKKPVPRTATFRIAAKLSLPGDPHLEREAANYLQFPAHFFQHWNGYNVVPPLHDPTPVGALVPQFFGYYKPVPAPSRDGYLSPLLLLEHCGKPICVDALSLDDRHECAALLFRFHSAGWVHESFAERNILMQACHPTLSPLEDDDKRGQRDSPYRPQRNSFRLIDFGRSVACTDGSKRCTEEMEAGKLFSILCG